MSSGAMYSPVSQTQNFPYQSPSHFDTRTSRLGSRPSHSIHPSQSSLGRSSSPINKSGNAERRSFFKVWWKEFATCFLILAALFAIVGTVLPFSGRTLPQWPYSLSINTLVSIYVAILKFAMAYVLAECIGQIKWTWFEHPRPLTDLVPYDNASRGSLWGSMKLLWMLRGRSMLASVGAIVTILSAIIDPFAQQLITYNACAVVDTLHNASVPITHTWFSNGRRESTVSVTLDANMQGAVFNGIVSQAPITVDFDCSTGNCTFTDIYYTLGFCSQCEDVTNDIIVNTQLTAVATVTDAMAATFTATTISTAIEEAVTDDSGTATIVTETLQATITATTFAFDAVYTQAAGIGPNFNLKSGLRTGSMIGDVAIGVSDPGDERMQMVFEMLYGGDSDITNRSIQNSSDTQWLKRGYGAVRCQLSPCVKGIQGSIEAGRIKETILTTSWNSSWSSVSSGLITSMVRTACLNDQQRAVLQQKTGQQTLPAWFGYKADEDKDQTVPKECYYSAESPGLLAILEFLGKTFNGSIHGDSMANEATSSFAQNAFFLDGNATFTSINGTISNITNAMSQAMRAHPYSTATQGLVQKMDTCVYVDWRWLSFPATLTFLTLVCFIMTSIVTHASRKDDDLRAHDFKTDVLPLMFAASRLREPPQDVRCSGVSGKVEESVKRRHVRFEKSADGWHFTESPASSA